MQLTIRMTRRREKALVVMRAVYAAKPGKEKKAARKALRRFKKANPKTA